jgi:hypothetical protein
MNRAGESPALTPTTEPVERDPEHAQTDLSYEGGHRMPDLSYEGGHRMRPQDQQH